MPCLRTGRRSGGRAGKRGFKADCSRFEGRFPRYPDNNGAGKGKPFSVEPGGGGDVFNRRSAVDSDKEADNTFTESLKYFLEQQKTDTFVVISADNLTPSSSLRKLCESSPLVACFACYADEGRDLQGFILQTLSSQGFRADAEAMAYLQAHLGADRKISKSELEKLMLYMGNNKNITQADAAACIGDASAQSVDVLIQAIAGGKHALVQEKLAALFQAGQSEVALIRAAGSYFQKLLLAKSRCLQGASIEQSVAQVVPKLNFKMEPEFKRQLAAWDEKNLIQALCLIEKGEKDCKTSAYVPSVMCAQLFLYLTQAGKRQCRY